VEVVGDAEFVEKKASEYANLLKEPKHEGHLTQGHQATTGTAGELKKTGQTGVVPRTQREKLAALRDEGYFNEPKTSSDLVEEFRKRIWGVYKANQISSMLIKHANLLNLRRVPLGQNKFGYAHP
jgi:hypothetical protein